MPKKPSYPALTPLFVDENAPSSVISPTQRPALPVANLVHIVSELLQTQLPPLWVTGEISNFTAASSGHWYFSLKDNQAQVRCVMFRSKAQKVGFVPRQGQKVEVYAQATLYEARGDFQLNVDGLREAGVGDLHEAFARLKQRLAAEGLFDAERKKPLPAHPVQLGVITSLQAAALRDVLTTLHRRAPHLKVVIYPCQVQGVEAPASIMQALRTAYARQECEVLLLCRGGGSLEDLWAYNDEALARLIATSPVPLVSAVGHETDFTIADFVADMRAPTPTAGAELISPDRAALCRELNNLSQRLRRAQLWRWQRWSQQLDEWARRLPSPTQQHQTRLERLQHWAHRLRLALRQQQHHAQWQWQNQAQRLQQQRPELNAARQKLAQLQQRAHRALLQKHQRHAAQLHHWQQLWPQLNPHAPLLKGYCWVEAPDGTWLRQRNVAAQQPHLQLHFHDGSLRVHAASDEPPA